MREFKTFHPIVNFSYFIAVILFSMFYMHPVCLAISFCTSFVYSIMLDGTRALKFNILYMIPMLILTAIMNPVFNHEGVTILAYLPDGNPLTLESVCYGIAAAVMLITVICWFSCYNKIITSDKFIYLFGRIMPSLSLIFSMILRFVPRFKEQLRQISIGQKCIGNDASEGNILKRIKCSIKILSIMVTWSLENAVETADSMKSRGYGLPGRTSFSNFVFDNRDKWVMFCILILSFYLFTGTLYGQVQYKYFPLMEGEYNISIFCAYFILCSIPISIECVEALKWKFIESQI